MRFFAVEIGRNIGNHPMTHTRWADFAFATFETVRGFAGTEPVITYGYNEADEEIAVIQAIIPQDERAQTSLNVTLANLAGQYNQEYVVVAWGTSLRINNRKVSDLHREVETEKVGRHALA